MEQDQVDGDNTGGSELVSLPSLMDNERGESSGRQDVSARAKFDSFLRTHTTLGKSLIELTDADVTHELFGQFLTFLLNDRVGFQTSMNYASSVKRQLEDTTGTEVFESKRGVAWYKRARQKLKDEYVQQAVSTGKQLRTQAPLMAIKDLSEIARYLFARNDAKGLADRTLLNNQWHVIGRSSDVGSITFDSLHWQDTYILIDVTRLIIKKQHALSIFCTPGDWPIDAFHSLACQLVATPYESSHMLFAQVGDGESEIKVAAYINRLFRDIYESRVADKITKNLQSHSSRRGGAAHASSHASVNLSDLAHRGMWSMDGFATLFEYLSPTTASDQTIAKVMSGWETPTRSAAPPTLRCFDRAAPDERARVPRFADRLHGLHFSRLDKRGFSDCLTATLLMYFDETRVVLDGHIVHQAMRDVATSVVGPSDVDSHLLAWGRQIRKQFVYDNVQSLPIGQMRRHLGDTADPDLFVSAHSLADSIERLVVAYQHLARTQEDIQATLRDVVHRLDLLSVQRDRPTPQVQASTTPSTTSAPIVPRALAAPRAPAAQWPTDLESLTGKRISEVMVQFVTCGLDSARRETRVQKEVARLMDIVEAFAVLRSIPQQPPADDPAALREWSNSLRRMASATEERIVAFLVAMKNK